MKRVVLTGATGFVGSHAVTALVARGFEVHAIGRQAPGRSDVAFHRADLLDPAAVEPVLRQIGASHLLHLAWYAEPGLYWRSPINLDWVAASLHLVQRFQEAGGTRVVAAGTCAEYAWGPERFDEHASERKPATLYGVAKDALFRLLASYAETTGLSFGWGRLFFLYGPGERRGRLVSDAACTLLAGERFATSPGHQRRDFSHVEDVAAAFAALCDSAVAGPVNIASGRAVAVRDVITKIAGLAGSAGEPDFGARALAPTEPSVIEADTRRLVDEVGFLPAFSLAAGLAQTVDFWRKGHGG